MEFLRIDELRKKIRLSKENPLREFCWSIQQYLNQSLEEFLKKSLEEFMKGKFKMFDFLNKVLKLFWKKNPWEISYKKSMEVLLMKSIYGFQEQISRTFSWEIFDRSTGKNVKFLVKFLKQSMFDFLEEISKGISARFSVRNPLRILQKKKL